VKISLNWLRDFVTWDWPPEELAHRLTMAGLNVESVTPYVREFPGVVVARVTDRRRHPDADKLSLCTVDDGSGEPLQIVCGAANVQAGQDVLLARIGAVLPGDLRIRKSKIRGVESHGMICSAAELQLAQQSEGILVLADAPAPGTPADELIGCRDTVLDIEVTPNRPDWLSHFGVAREVAALSGRLLDGPALWSPPKTGGDRPDFPVEIADFADCPRYTAHVARGVKIGPSPRWLQDRLLAVGARPINNVVDVTNYVMLELGQPLHAFDLKKLSGNRLSVRRGTPGTRMLTLDGVERELTADDLLIADAAGPVALAGVIGGADSQVDVNTVEILLESAYFDPGAVRRGARRHQLSTEASYRFERGADWDAVEDAAHRALHLLQELAGVRVDPTVVDRQNPDRREPAPLTIRVAQANRLLGTELSMSEMLAHLQAIGLKSQPVGRSGGRQGGDGKFMVTVPSFRRDLHEEVDLIEEIARMHGFDNIADGASFRGGAGVRRRPQDELAETARGFLAAVGYSEIVTSSFMERADLDRLGLPAADPRREMLAVRNPHSGSETLLRTTLVPSLLRTARHNVNADRELPFRLFQLNKAFLPGARRPQQVRHEDERRLPRETWTLQAAVVGRADRVLGGADGGLLEIKGLVEALSAQLRLSLTLDPQDAEPYLQPGCQWSIRDEKGAAAGSAGLVARKVLRDLDLDAPVALCEVELGDLDPAAATPRFAPFSRFPAAKRDLSLLVPDGVGYDRIREVVQEAAGGLLQTCDLFDVYRGAGLGEGRAAFGIRLKFQSAKGSLQGKAVDAAVAAVTEALARTLNVELRG